MISEQGDLGLHDYSNSSKSNRPVICEVCSCLLLREPLFSQQQQKPRNNNVQTKNNSPVSML